MFQTEHAFEVVAREWLANRNHELEEATGNLIMKRLETYVFPKLGKRPVSAINAPEVLSMLRVVESKGLLDTAHRIKQTCGKIFMYAIATGRAERNPVPDLRGALKTRVVKHRAYLEATELPKFLKKLNEYDGEPLTRLAVRFLLLTFVRPGEQQRAVWKEFDLDRPEWRIPPERMKMRETHIVPLSRQAVKVLREIRGLTGPGDHVFPNINKSSGFMSENTILFALYRMGYHSRATAHGFRSTASTILNARLSR